MGANGNKVDKRFLGLTDRSDGGISTCRNRAVSLTPSFANSQRMCWATNHILPRALRALCLPMKMIAVQTTRTRISVLVSIQTQPDEFNSQHRRQSNLSSVAYGPADAHMPVNIMRCLT
ncbi:hypothetical protein GALMADRAFT_863226 [Galerina marginata CBS 339.88]|uniref:Uncharacterized protein n=1 Tax=Galerina marginata (strain CBS 339.88) TaxID=685588 RepID=A0A067TVJ4_GALM3|nr:hypothetical protein GALMADRAFT_863226 [Galerina marginata CBS 339.88]